PRGVAFLAGPTGVGKTELAKTVTSLLFGDESAYIRFDMSEFSAEHADQRLIGAPPGYVGYDVGGELTNAIREKPFSVVLFDEIEKAHP
ncbi:AAA family ATPase, partial [Salmonella enterica]